MQCGGLVPDNELLDSMCRKADGQVEELSSISCVSNVQNSTSEMLVRSTPGGLRAFTNRCSNYWTNLRHVVQIIDRCDNSSENQTALTQIVNKSESGDVRKHGSWPCHQPDLRRTITY